MGKHKGRRFSYKMQTMPKQSQRTRSSGDATNEKDAGTPAMGDEREEVRRRWMWYRVLENGEHESEIVRYRRAMVVSDGKRKSGESTSVWGRHGLARRLGFLLPQRLRPSTFGERN
ncbi:hypothetical protein PIB30_104977, partial [Stylosanthes scabra]|nr:hypothetical protein [Stylosanthes scabra]